MEISAKDLFEPRLQAEHSGLLIKTATEMLNLSTDGVTERTRDACGLLKKCIYHTATVFNLANTGITISNVTGVKDYQSAAVIARSNIESALVLGYVICGGPSVSEDEMTFRRAVWRRGGIERRGNLVHNPGKHKPQMDANAATSAKLKSVIEATMHYKSLTADGQKKALKEDWRPVSWEKAIVELGLREQYIAGANRDFSQYVHSKSTVIFKAVEQDKTQEDDVCRLALIRSLVALSLAMGFFSIYLESSRHLLKQDPATESIWGLYVVIGTEDISHLRALLPTNSQHAPDVEGGD